MKVYFDNAATTPLDKEVVDAMLPVMHEQFGNPSSIHVFGRETRAAIENARTTVANLLNVSPAEIFFTSGGTESNNTAIRCSIDAVGLKHVITTKIEHHSVLHTLEMMKKRESIKLSFVNLKKDGHVDLQHLKELLSKNERSLVSLMHANNEIGNLLPIKRIGDICEEYNAVLHSDTVQTMGHYIHDLQKVKVHFVACSPHKFHGPKGVGFLCVNGDIKIDPLIYGGSQERDMRGGTENIYGIVGLAKAFEVAHRDMEKDQEYIQGLKTYMIEQLKSNIPGVQFNGDHKQSSLYTVLNVSLPPTDNAEMLLFNLDIAGIACSGGSACASGSNVGSHVLEGIGCDMDRPAVRFSFSKLNTKDEIDYCVTQITQISNPDYTD